MRISDLSSDVCSSDLEVGPRPREEIKPVVRVPRERSGELVRAVPERAFGSRAEARPVRPGRVAEGSEQQPVDAFELRPGQEPRLHLLDEALQQLVLLHGVDELPRRRAVLVLLEIWERVWKGTCVA